MYGAPRARWLVRAVLRRNNLCKSVREITAHLTNLQEYRHDDYQTLADVV
jgi:hypothetical protein